VFSLSAAMAGLGGVFYAGQQGGIGANDVQFIGSLTLLLWVAVWGIRTITGALLGGLTAAALPVVQPHLPTVPKDFLAVAAGVAFTLLARSNDGILGLQQLRDRFTLPLGDHEVEPPALLIDSEVVHA